MLKKLLLVVLTLFILSGCLRDSNNEPCAGFDTIAQRDFLEENKLNDDIIVTDSGLQYRVIEEGDGSRPRPNSDVIVRYVGTLTDGTTFDSSSSARFPLNNVIFGFREAIQLMNVGSIHEVFIPPSLGYGDRPPANSEICPGQVLIFEIELLDIR